MEDLLNSIEAPEGASPLPYPAVAHNQRLSSPYAVRIPAIISVCFFTGLMLGVSQGSTMAGLRFRAENSHRFPTSATGWYLYHKSKNYHKMLGGLKEGFRMGGKVAFWGGSFFAFEELVDSARGTKDFISTSIAGLSVAGGFSLWSKLYNRLGEVAKLNAKVVIRQVPHYNGRAYGKDGADRLFGVWSRTGRIETG